MRTNIANTAKLGLILLSVLLTAPTVFAAGILTTPTHDQSQTQAIATGTFTDSITYTSSRTAGGNTFLTAVGDIVDSGDNVGTISWTGTIAIHSDGTDEFHANGTWTGTVLGSAPGTLNVSFEGSGAGAAFQAHVNFEQGTGGLVGVHMQGNAMGTFTSPTTTAGTYSYQVVYGPS